MGGDATPKSPLWGAVGDEGVTPQEVAGDGAEVRKRKGREGGNNDGEGGDYGERQDFGGTIRDRGVHLDDGRGPPPVSIPGR